VDEYQVKYCVQCGAENVVAREITPSHIYELYCPHCGLGAILLWRDHSLVGTVVTHDPDSDSEAW